MQCRDFDDLVRIMARLRGPGGCPWDRRQTHRSLLRYLREESREVEQAVRRGDHENLREELGDLLLQILFHSQIAGEKGRFTIRHVVRDLGRKLVRRHPHVFGGAEKLRTAGQVVARWDELKKREKAMRRRR
jgi:tetrapyrrole methylase family protein/MazG family protein